MTEAVADSGDVPQLKRALALAEFQLANVNSVVLRWDQAGIITHLNKYGQDLFGYPEAEIVGLHIMTIVPETDARGSDLKAMIADLLEHPEAYEHNENENVCKDGSRVWMLWRNKPILTDDGELLEILTVGVDITARKKLERELEDANRRMSRELDVGREIQMSMLPLTFPAFPEHEEFSVHATLRPAREVGGDFYDFFFVSEDEVCFCVGDVSDKGVPAALFMAVTKALLKSKATDLTDPGRIVSKLNDEISRDNPSCMFVTLFLGSLNIRTGVFRFTNAGHNRPYVCRAGDDVRPLEPVHGPVIGARGGTIYGEGELRLVQGDSIVMYTDGVTEAMDFSSRLYGEERLENVLRDMDWTSTEDLVTGVVSSVDAFVAGAEQSDDVTILALRFSG